MCLNVTSLPQGCGLSVSSGIIWFHIIHKKAVFESRQQRTSTLIHWATEGSCAAMMWFFLRCHIFVSVIFSYLRKQRHSVHMFWKGASSMKIPKAQIKRWFAMRLEEKNLYTFFGIWNEIKRLILSGKWQKFESDFCFLVHCTQ